MLSIFTAMVACLCMSVIPPADVDLAKSLCMPIHLGTVNNASTTQRPSIAANQSDLVTQERATQMDEVDVSATTNIVLPVHVSHPVTTQKSTTKSQSQSPSTKMPTSSTVIVNQGNMYTTTTTPETTVSMESITRRNVSGSDQSNDVWNKLPDELRQKLISFGISEESIHDLSMEQVQQFIQNMIKELHNGDNVLTPSTKRASTTEKVNIWYSLSPEIRQTLEKYGINSEDVKDLTKEQLKMFIDEMLRRLENEPNSSGGRKKRDIISTTLNKIHKQFSVLQKEVSASQNMVFAFVLCIIIVGEVFSCPTEKLSDKIWFDLVDGLDVIEKYGTHRSWCVLGFIFVPLLVTALVDHTPCMLPHGINHINIHFYMYAGFMGLALIFAFIYPILRTSKKAQRRSKVMKGLKILFVDIHGFSYTFSILLLGFLSASLENFLFWVVQDLGGTELIMGGALSLAALSELGIFICMKWFLQKISHVGAVIMGFMVMAVRLVIYSFLWASYMILPVAILHAFSGALLVGAVENYSDFKVNPLLMDRSAKGVLQGIYIGLGYATGSVVSGVLVDLYGLAAVFQGGAIICVSWCVVFALIHKCVKRKQKVRYARLLQAEEDQGSDDSESVDDDWLETALKHEK